jgi:hypothetical protein
LGVWRILQDDPEVVRTKDGEWRPDDLAAIDICSRQALKAVSADMVEEL